MNKSAFLLPLLLLSGLLLASCGHCKTEDPRPARTLSTSEGQAASGATTPPKTNGCMSMHGSMMNGM